MQSSHNQSSEVLSLASQSETHTCPTRRDGAEGLIAQTVTSALCQTRQRGGYHKCWSCANRNSQALRPDAPKLRLAGTDAEPRAITG
jgi:hypothetical protein